MSLRCVDETGVDLYAFDLSPEAWQALIEQNRKCRSLRMPCCSAEVNLRRSHRRAKTKIVTGVDVVFGPHTNSFSVPQLGEYPALFDEVFSRLPWDLKIGPFRP